MAKVAGFLLVPSKDNTEKNINFDVWISERDPRSKLFFTNPSVREAINSFREYKKGISVNMGYYQFSRHPSSTQREPVYEYSLSPYINTIGKKDRERRGQEHFKSKGIAINLEKMVLEELLKISPKAYLTPFMHRSTARIEQFRKHGINLRSRGGVYAKDLHKAICKVITKKTQKPVAHNTPKKSTKKKPKKFVHRK
jgi:hypothetical protein